MSEGVFLVPRTLDDGVLKRATVATLGLAGASISAKRGRVYRVSVVNKSATGYFVQIHDKATAPTAGNVPVWEARLLPNDGCVIDFDIAGLALALGFGIAISTTAGTLTLAAADDAVAYAQYTVQT